MGLDELWFVLIAVLWTGFFVLEGFDFGVGMLHTVVGRTEVERQAAINTIGPFWDGNEVWLITAGAAIFAAFPSWYAAMFSAFYLALVLILVALMGRGVALEYRAKGRSERWTDAWTWVLTLGSALLPLLFGVAFGDLLHGLPIDKNGDFTGTFFDLLTPYGLWVGVTLLSACVLCGATFLTLRTTHVVRGRSRRLALRLVWPVALVVAIFAVWTVPAYAHSVFGVLLPLLAPLAVAATYWFLEADREGWAFGANALALSLIPISIFVDLHPKVMVSSTNSAYNLTVSGTAAGHYSLEVMTVAAVIFLPVVLLYQAWNYYVFRKRVSAPRTDSPESEAVAAGDTTRPAR